MPNGDATRRPCPGRPPARLDKRASSRQRFCCRVRREALKKAIAAVTVLAATTITAPTVSAAEPPGFIPWWQAPHPKLVHKLRQDIRFRRDRAVDRAWKLGIILTPHARERLTVDIPTLGRWTHAGTCAHMPTGSSCAGARRCMRRSRASTATRARGGRTRPPARTTAATRWIRRSRRTTAPTTSPCGATPRTGPRRCRPRRLPGDARGRLLAVADLGRGLRPLGTRAGARTTRRPRPGGFLVEAVVNIH